MKYNLGQDGCLLEMGNVAELHSTFVLLMIALAVVPAAVAAAPDEAGTFVVGFRELPDAARNGRYADEAVARVDDALGFAVVDARNARGFEERALRDPNVRYVQREVYAETDWTPNDPYYAQQFGWARMNAPAAWDVTRGSTGVTVAIIDTGVDRTHPDLAGPRLLPGYDYMSNDVDPTDDCGHGTGVTGVVAASTGNGVGVAGAAQVNVMPLRALGLNPDGKCYGPFSAVASSIRYAADNGARVISMSLGCTGCYDQATNDAINYAWSKGALLVASAGNSGPTLNSVSWPAAHDKVIAVACTDSADAQCYFSSSGPQVEIAAPGKSIYTTSKGGGYFPMSGTSLSAPHVSGALALALSANPSWTNTDLRARLATTAKDLGAPGRDDAFGYGLVNMAALVGSAPAPAPLPNQAPTASFTAAPTGLTADVDASASTDADGTIASYQWTWGDGIGFNSGTCPTAAHAYATAGTYTITLTVTDNAGATSTTTRTVTVTAPNQAPTASFTTSASGLTATTDGRASSDPDGTIASYQWAWGDGATGTGATASHAYAAAGTYTVTLTVTDNVGAQGSTSASVTVVAPAPAPAPRMHVEDMTGAAKRTGSVQRLTWTVTMRDATGGAVGGASVTATVAGVQLTAVTDALGVASFRYDAPRAGGVTYTLCVSSASLSGWTYDAAANVVGCRSVVTK